MSDCPRVLLACGLTLESLANRISSLIDERLNIAGHAVREDVCNPHEPALAAAVVKHLHRSVVVCQCLPHRRPDESTRVIIDIHDQLANGHAICEGDDSGAALEASIREHPGAEPLVDGTNIAHCIPYDLGRYTQS